MDRGGILPQCERLVSLQSRIQHPVGVKEGRAEEIAGETVLPTTIQIDTGKRPSVYRLRRILPRSSMGDRWGCLPLAMVGADRPVGGGELG